MQVNSWNSASAVPVRGIGVHLFGTLVQTNDAAHGLPTCSHCQQQFANWASFRYHVEYVCSAAPDRQDRDGQLSDLEHRLRVTELIQYSNDINLQALTQHHDVLQYFKTHCVMCGVVQRSDRGMLLHWATEHASIYQRHGDMLRLLHAQHPVASPCAG